MRVVQTHSKRVVFGILLSALIVGVMLTIGQVPLAVSQPVTIAAKAVKGTIPMDGANPVWESVPGVIVPLSGQLITTPMHPNISVKSVFVNPDIILMDIQMPKMDGLEATHHLRMDPRFAATPIIALTALVMPGDRERCFEAWVNEYISKPVSLKTILSVIERFTETKK